MYNLLYEIIHLILYTYYLLLVDHSVEKTANIRNVKSNEPNFKVQEISITICVYVFFQ